MWTYKRKFCNALATAAAVLLAVSALPRLALAETLLVTGQTSTEGPSLAVFNGNLFMAWTGTDSNHSINVAKSSDGLHFGPPVVFPNNSSVWFAAPAITAFNAKMHLTWTGYYNDINIASSTDGLHYSNQSLVRDPHTGAVQTAYGSTALAAANGKLYLAWSGTDGVHTINVATSTDGVDFTHPNLYTIYGSGSPWSPALGTGFNNQGMTVAFTLPIVVPEQPCRVVYGLPVGGGPSFRLPACPPGAYYTGPGLGVLGTEFFVAWVGTNLAPEVHIDKFGTTGHTSTATGQTCIGNPAIIGFNGHVYYAWTGTDGAHTINIARFQ